MVLEILPHGCAQEHEDLQAEVNAACIGLEHECATFRHEITSTMKTKPLAFLPASVLTLNQTLRTSAMLKQ